MPKPSSFSEDLRRGSAGPAKDAQPVLASIEMEPGFLPEPRTTTPSGCRRGVPADGDVAEGFGQELYRRLEVACQKAGYSPEHDGDQLHFYNAYLARARPTRWGYVYGSQFEGAHHSCGCCMEHLSHLLGGAQRYPASASSGVPRPRAARGGASHCPRRSTGAPCGGRTRTWASPRTGPSRRSPPPCWPGTRSGRHCRYSGSRHARS